MIDSLVEAHSTAPQCKNLVEFLAYFSKVKHIGHNEYEALCPAHNDHNPSLNITLKDGKFLVHCKAGCSTKAIVQAVDLTMAHLFTENHNDGHKPHLGSEPVVTYDYKDENGKLIFQVCRYIPKAFKQRQPGGNGNWIWNLDGVTPLLYKLPDVFVAKKHGDLVFFVEGEKDAETMWQWGLVATTTPMGANKKWLDNYTEALAGAHVRIIPDQDSPGIRWGNTVAKKLSRVAASLKVLSLPQGIKDVSEWVEQGAALDEAINQLERATPHWQLPAELESTDENPNKYALTDLGNAERLASQFGDRLRYCYERKRWLFWTGQVWEWDWGNNIKALAKLAVRNIYQEAADEPNKKRREELANHAKSSESDHRINAMISLTESELGIPVKVTELDTNPWLFNCLNGTIELKTGLLLTHRKEDLLTIIVPVEYHAGAPHPQWLTFLEQVTNGNSELAKYLQCAVGYSLTGDTKSQVLFFLYGLGNNGKSTFVTTIRKLTGGYGERVNTDLFIVKDKNTGGPKEALANLKGKRYVVASEIEDGKRLAVSLIKDMTGGETIKADRKYEHEIEYQPTHKLWIVGNHKLVITDTTLSIWRRVKLIPFTVTIPDNEIDPDLPSKLEAELPGILAWAIKGCLDWQHYGLPEPETVTTATASYRHEQDILGDFIEDCCILEPLASISKADLKSEYERWCNDNNIDSVSPRTFRSRLIEKGITDGKSGSIRYWKGITLKILVPNGTENVPDLATDGTTGTENSAKSLYEGNQKDFTENSVLNVPVSQKGDIPDYPTHPCHKCGCGAYWLADWNEWLCSGCHPKLEEDSQ